MRELKKDIWPYRLCLEVGSDDLMSDQISAWIKDHMGFRFKDWYSYTFDRTTIYAFRDSEAMMVFKLKWGQYVIG